MPRRTSFLPHERLDAYRVAIELIAGLRSVHETGLPPHIRDQLQRASLSIALNIAEGTGRVGKDRLKFYRIARGSACETGALLDAIEVSGVELDDSFEHLHNLCARLYAMLTRLAELQIKAA
ncbi:MAG: four helix bundle protein [Deltaproteobacteria bacterium]|nr:four helix bundle protein [Deltaproteobacteria bacterium]